MTTISADAFVSVIPSVLAAGGDALDLSGLFVTQNTRPPTGLVVSFPSAAAVSSFFGPSAPETALAAIYFNGFDNSTVKPGALLFAQYPQAAVPAYLRGGNLSSLTLAQLQAISGTLTVVVDGVARVAGSLNLSAATSFTSGASIIQTALNASPPAEATVTAAIAPATSSFTGSIAGNIMTVTAISSGVIVPGTVVTGTGVTAGTVVQNQLSGTAGGIGTYAVNNVQVVASEALSGAYGTLTVSAVSSGTLSVGQTLTGTGVTAGTQITGLGTGIGLTGTYFVNPSQTVGSETINAVGTNVAVAFDSVSGAFVITSGVLIGGPASTVGFATGTTSAPLLLTQAAGATLSQGAAGQTPSTFMNGVVDQTQNWATFMLTFDPDDGAGNTQKLAFAQWNGLQGSRYAFMCWDTDQSPATTLPASASLGQLIAAGAIDGTALFYRSSSSLNVTPGSMAAFACGIAASIDFEETDGRTTFAYRSQSGLFADVTSGIVAANLAGSPLVPGSFGNNYNYYGAIGTANQTFVNLQRGTISGKFQWLDSFINQIWLNNAFQLDLMLLLTQRKSIPYNNQGRGLIEAALADTINQAVTFGAIRPGVTLSALQIAEVNASANANIAPTLSTRGWYLQINDATPQVRQARGSPPCTFFYMDGQSVQAISLASVLLQ